MPRINRGARLQRNERGVYEVRWTEEGRSRRVSARTTDAAEAADFLRAWQADLNREADESSASTVRGVLARYWTEHVEARVVAQGTARIAVRHLNAHFGDMAPVDIRPADVRAYARERAAGRIGKPAGAATARRELAVLSAALNHAVTEGRMPRASVPAIPLPPASAPNDDWLREDEMARLFEAAAADRPDGRMSRVERWLLLAYHTGRRAEAIERLTWAQVDLDAKRIDFDQAGRARTKKRRGFAAINVTLLGALRRAHSERTGEWVLDHPGKIRHALAALGKRAGVPRVHPHLLKHTCITHLLRRGVRVWDVAGAVATSAATIERVYGKHAQDSIATVVEALA
jgi:integrase